VTSPRRRRIGAAYVQALVVMLMMIAVFAGAISFGHAFDAKIVSGQKARALAWQAGANGCGSSSSSQVTADSKSVAQNLEQNAQGDVVQKLGNLFFRLSARTEQASQRQARIPTFAGGGATTFQTTTQFACNETPDLHGDLASIAGWAIDLFKKVL